MSYVEQFKQNMMTKYQGEIIPNELKTSEFFAEFVKKYATATLRYATKELITPEMCLLAVKNEGRALCYVPEEMKTPELCMEAVKNYGEALGYVPEKMKTLEICLEAVKKDGSALEYVPEELMTPEICLEAVKNDGLALEYVPEELMESELCMEAVKNNGLALEYVSEELMTPEICLEAVKNNGSALGYVPEELMESELCMEAVKNNSLALEYLPDELMTPEICLEAVKNDGSVLEYVPEELITSEICLEAVKNYGSALEYVPEELITPEICLEAVKEDGSALEGVPEELITPEIYLEAVKNYGEALYYIPEELMTPEICLEAVKNNGLVLRYVPEELMTPEICLEAVKEDGSALKYVPKEKRTPELCMEAVKNYGSALCYVSEEKRTPELCMEAVKEDGSALKYVPKEKKTPELCMEAVKNNGGALQFVPEEMITPKMCLEAIKNASGSIESVPKGMRTLEMLLESWDSSAVPLTKLYDFCKKADKFNDVSHFIPIFYILEKYPEEQIEKFNKKIWFSLARNDLFNTNIDTKCALVEAILSFGAFEKDSTRLERIGLLQKMATHIPKEESLLVESLNEFIEENFKIVEKITETAYYIDRKKLLSDTNIINLFGSKEQAELAIKELANRYSEEEMKQAVDSIETDEQVDENYKKVMLYIYKNGYNKVERPIGYLVKLAKDIQQEKIRNKKAGSILEDKIRKFYYEHNSRLIMTPNKLHRIFDGMDMKYKPGFYEFFKDNYEQILEDEAKQSELSKIQRQWDKIVEANLGQKINFEKCESYIYNNQYKNVAEDELEIAKLSSNCGYSQADFEKVQAIFREQKKRTKSSIPQIEKKNEKTGYTYKVLRLDDPTAIFVGELTDCCQALGNAGESCMKHSVTSPNGRVLVVQDESGKILSQSWIWRNKNTICFDNIEAVEKDSNNKKIISSDLLSVIKGAAKDFVETDKAQMQKWKEKRLNELEEERESGKIDEQEYSQEKNRIKRLVEGQQLTKVTVGIGYTDVNLSGLKPDNENKYPEEYVDYIDDSRIQFILYEDTNIEHKENEEKTVAMYADDENASKLIDIDISEIYVDDELGDDWEEDNDEREYNDDDDWEEDDDEREYNDDDDWEEDDEREYDDDDEGQNNSIDVDDIKTAIQYVQNRKESRIALQNIEKWLEENNMEI